MTFFILLLIFLFKIIIFKVLLLEIEILNENTEKNAENYIKTKIRVKKILK